MWQRFMYVFVAAAPQMESEQREHAVDKGETLKVKIPFSGTGPFSFKLKKGSREIPDSDRVKLIPFEDYVVLQIKGKQLLPGTTDLAPRSSDGAVT